MIACRISSQKRGIIMGKAAIKPPMALYRSSKTLNKKGESEASSGIKANDKHPKHPSFASFLFWSIDD